MPSNNSNGKQGNNNGRGPPWAASSHASRKNGAVQIGPRPKRDARDRIEAASSQMDRLEAKLDLILAQMEAGR